MKKWLPVIPAAVLALWFLSGAQPPKLADGFDVAAFGRLPVLLNGRVQPLDTVARNSLLSMSGRSTVRLPGGHSLSATQWLLETMTQPNLADQRKVFRVQHPDLQGLLGPKQQGLQYYSYNDLTNQLPSLQAKVLQIQEAEGKRGEDAEKERDPYQRDLMHLCDSLGLYDRLKCDLGPPDTEDFQTELQVYEQTRSIAAGASQNAAATNSPAAENLRLLDEFQQRYARVAAFTYTRAEPP
ncbi:MAG: hypothetical protein ABSG04_06090 [Verrucomicrobiota bacterium]